MSRRKHLLTLLLSLVAVAAAAFLPPVLSRARDRLSLPGVHLETAEPLTLDAESALTLEEKLTLMCLTRQESSRVITSVRELSQAEAASVWEDAKQELELMMKSGAFSAGFDPARLLASQLTLIVYTDIEDLSRSVSIWNLSLADPEGTSDHFLFLSLDTETGKILEFSFALPYRPSVDVSSDGDSPYPSFLESTVKGFGEYLGIDWQLPPSASEGSLEFSSADKKIRYILYGDGVTDLRMLLF